MIRAVAFDLDDTLYSEVQFVYSGYRAVSEAVSQRLGVQLYDELVALFENGQRGDLLTPLLRKHWEDVDETYIRQLVQVYQEHPPEIRPYSEVRRVLGKLKQSYGLAIISDGFLSVQQRKLRALKISHFFSAVIFSDQWGRNYWKPDRRPFEECCRQLLVDPTSVAYIGDNPSKDFVTARRMGMKTIRVRRPGTLHYNLHLSAEFEADIEANTLEDIPRLLQS